MMYRGDDYAISLGALPKKMTTSISYNFPEHFIIHLMKLRRTFPMWTIKTMEIPSMYDFCYILLPYVQSAKTFSFPSTCYHSDMTGV